MIFQQQIFKASSVLTIKNQQANSRRETQSKISKPIKIAR